MHPRQTSTHSNAPGFAAIVEAILTGVERSHQGKDSN
jgi:hypothetical protein